MLPHITRLINDSLSSTVFPGVFKEAIVKPLLKKHGLDMNELSNYRPVSKYSNLQFLSKVLEKIVLIQIEQHLDTNSLRETFQSAYRAKHSTETALVRVTSDPSGV